MAGGMAQMVEHLPRKSQKKKAEEKKAERWSRSKI
jgi:hypothetical protein